MKTAIIKSFLVSAIAAVVCVAISVLIGVIRGVPAGMLSISISLIFPLITAFPAMIVVFHRNSQLSKAYNALEKAHQELQARSKIDYMTGLYNREAFFEMMRNVRSRVDAGALLLIDADHFKNINDQHGHAVGDRALKLIAYALQNVTRKGDLVGRVGGEEFCVYLPNAGRVAAAGVAERIRVEIENTPFYIAEHRTEPLTVSTGGAIAQKSDSNSQIFSRADHCLYEAKNQGRNCVVFEKTDVAANDALKLQLVSSACEEEKRRHG